MTTSGLVLTLDRQHSIYLHIDVPQNSSHNEDIIDRSVDVRDA